MIQYILVLLVSSLLMTGCNEAIFSFKKAPQAVSVSAPADGYYQDNSHLDFIVTFSKEVTISGSPRLIIDLAGTDVYALPTSIGPAQSFTFRYTVQPSDGDADGITLAPFIDLNGGTITTLEGSTPKLTFTVPDLSGVILPEHNVYFISSSGNDSNSGLSPNEPWQTLTNIYPMNVTQGVSFLFKGGETFSGFLYFDDNDTGNATYPIVIGSYGTGMATINSSTNNGFFAYNTSGFVIKDLIFTGADGATNYKYGVFFYNDLAGNIKLPYIRIDNVKASGYANGGIVLMGYNGSSGYDDIRITNVEAFDNAQGGLWVWSDSLYGITNIYVGHSKFYNNLGTPGVAEPTGSGIVFGRTDGGVIEHCIAYGNGINNTSTSGPIGIWAYDSNNITIQYSESYANKTSGRDGGGFDLDGGVTNSVMQYNYSHDNDGTGFMAYQYSGAPPQSGNIIRYNVSENDGQKNSASGILIGGASPSDLATNLQVYNNTIYTSYETTDPSVIYIMNNNVENIFIRNNIFVSAGGAKIVDMPVTNEVLFQGNNYFSSGDPFVIKMGSNTYNSLAAWKAADLNQERIGGTDLGSSVDPLLIDPGMGGTVGNTTNLSSLNAYKLQATSPMRNSGLDLNALFGLDVGVEDFWGNSLPQNGQFDVGAHEAP